VAGRKQMIVTHSEIFPGTFASTTETADWLLHALGLRRTPVLRWGPRGMQQLSEVRTEAAQIRDGARAEGQRIVEEMRANAQAESDRIVSRGEQQLASQRSSIVRELRSDLGGLAVELSERIIGERLATDAAVRSTVDAFLADLERSEAREGQPG
jgi:vacuolar-type H+-ATPase subunit H